MHENSLSKDEVKDIFLGKKVQWQNNSKIHFVISRDLDLHKSFLKTYIKRSPKQFRAYWRQMVFTGKGTSPKSFPSEKELLEYVSNNGGAIGYVEKNVATDAVKTIQVN